MWVWILAVAAAISVVVIALLSAPVELSFQVQRNVSWKANLTVSWMFGLLRFPATRGKRRPDGRPKRQKPKQRKRARAFPRRLWRVMLQAEFRGRLARLLRQTVAAIRLRDFWLRMRLGLDDPAETGFLWAYLGPVMAFVSRRPNAVLDVAPEFSGAALEVETQGRIRVIPAQVAWLALTFALSPVTLRAVWGQLGRR